MPLAIVLRYLIRWRSMSRAWVINHPAHAKLLAPIIESLGQSDDLIIAVKRKEVQNMLADQMNPIKISRIIWVPRLIGFFRWMKLVWRIVLAKKHLRNIQSVVSIGAPIEILFGPRSAKRIYITDTEPNLTAHRLARKKATDIVIPQHFKDELAPILFDTKATIHRLNGLHGHIHLNPGTLRKKPNTPYKILARKIRGNGSHDRNEWVPISDKIFTGFEVISVDEDSEITSPWELDKLIAASDGVITQSVTLASEACLLGIPTLLFSKAQRGFLDVLEREDYPLLRVHHSIQEVPDKFIEMMNDVEKTHSIQWPNTREELLKIL